MFICPHPICGNPPSPKKRLYFNYLFNTILNEETGCLRQGATSWLLMLVNAPHPALHGREGHIRFADISSNAPFTCSHTNIFSLCLILQIYLVIVRRVPVKGFVGRVGAHRRGHVIKTVGLLHNGTKKTQFVGFRFSYIISQCGNVAGLVSLLCLLYE